MSTKNLNLDTE